MMGNRMEYTNLAQVYSTERERERRGNRWGALEHIKCNGNARQRARNDQVMNLSAAAAHGYFDGSDK